MGLTNQTQGDDMGFMDTVAKLFKKESADLKEAISGAEQRANATLDRKEREMAMTPEERMAQIQGEIDDQDPMAEMRDKIEHKSAKAETVEEMSAAERAAKDSDGDPLVIDGEVISDTATPDAATPDSATSGAADADATHPDSDPIDTADPAT